MKDIETFQRAGEIFANHDSESKRMLLYIIELFGNNEKIWRAKTAHEISKHEKNSFMVATKIETLNKLRETLIKNIQ